MQEILVFVLDFSILGGAICLYFFFDEKKQMEGLLFTALFLFTYTENTVQREIFDIGYEMLEQGYLKTERNHV